MEILKKPICKQFYYSKKLNALLDIDVKLFNHVVFEYLKTTDYPVGKLESFPLLDNDEVLVKDDIFRLLRDSGVGVPAYYEEIPFAVDGLKRLLHLNKNPVKNNRKEDGFSVPFLLK